MIIGIIGSGGREHAICSSLTNSKKVNKIFQGRWLSCQLMIKDWEI